MRAARGAGMISIRQYRHLRYRPRPRPQWTQATKGAIRTALSMPLEAGIRYENEIHVICMSDQDRAEGIKAFQEKRP